VWKTSHYGPAGAFEQVVSCDYLCPQDQVEATMHGWTTGEQPHPLPSPDCDGSPGPPAGFSHCCEADRHWRGPPTPNSSSRESACLEQMPRSFGPSADAVDDECRCDALPHSWGSAWTPVETAQAQDGLCHGPLGLQRHPPAHLWRTFSLAHRPALGASVSPDAPVLWQGPDGRTPPRGPMRRWHRQR
jgi:hypothetical protein